MNILNSKCQMEQWNKGVTVHCAGENWAALVKIWRSGSPTTRSGNLTRIVSVSKSEILHSKLTRYRYKHSSKQNIKIEKMEIEREMYSGWNSGQIELGSTMLAFAPQSTYPSTWELILTTSHPANTNTSTNANTIVDKNTNTQWFPCSQNPLTHPSTSQWKYKFNSKNNCIWNYRCKYTVLTLAS